MVFPISQTKPLAESLKAQLPQRADQLLFGAAAILVVIAFLATFT
jgi:hypothetical protein